MTMTPTDRKRWAKEQLLQLVDDWIADDTTQALELRTFDDRRAIEVERDRIAKLFKLPTRY